MNLIKFKAKTPGKIMVAIIAMNVFLVLLIVYEVWFLKGLYSSLAGQFEGSSNLRVSRINLDYYHKALDRYEAAQSYTPGPQEVNNPFR